MNLVVPPNIRFQSASDQTLFVHFGSGISLETHREIVAFLRLLEAESLPGIVNLHPAYCSVLVKFDAIHFTHGEIEAALAPLLARLHEAPLPQPRTRKIPVCYGSERGPDLAEVASLHGMTEADVIRLHSSAEYLVYFLGFVPGFAYLGGLPAKLETPRLRTPRRKVPAGSVAIGGNQTGVYPIATPGGWRLIGQTPVPLFQPEAEEKSLLAVGDRVVFVPVDEKKFEELSRR